MHDKHDQEHSTNSLFSFLVFFPFLSLFRSNPFFFLLTLFFFLCRENPLFSIPFTGHGNGLFIVPAVTSVLLFCPLTAFVWSGHACQSYKTPARQRRIHFVYSVHRRLILSFCVPRPFLPRCLFPLSSHSEHALNGSLSNCLFWVVYHPSRTYLPKEA